MKKKDIKKEREVVKTKVYKITATYYNDNTFSLHRICDGFNAIELIGLLEKTQLDIMKQMAGEIRPSQVEREFVKDSLGEK